MKIEVCKTIRFDAAHAPTSTPADHKCHGLHGHTWVCHVWVTGPVAKQSGWIVDFHDLEHALRTKVFNNLDHSILNETLENPTTENLAVWIYEVVKSECLPPHCSVSRIEIQEGDTCFCTLTPDSL